jgi:capsid protein
MGNYRLDEMAARFIEWHWWRFCTYRNPDTGQTWCDATGRKTDSEIDRLNVKTQRRDGEYFINILRTDANPYGNSYTDANRNSYANSYANSCNLLF